MIHDAPFLDRLQHLLADHLGHWGFGPAARLRLLTISENATFLAEEGERRIVLRAHRPGYHSEAEILSELAWIAALRQERLVATAAPVPGADGSLLLRLPLAAAGFVSAFTFLPGRSPEPGEDLRPRFADLGAISARLHAHARAWARPPGFTRKSWTVATALGAPGHWGDWRAALGLTPGGRALLSRAEARIAAMLGAYGQGPARFGLIHGDLRLANLLVEADRLQVIDFDDCGFSWFMYDFAAAVSFFEHAPVVAELAEAWVAGYRQVAPLSPEDAAILPALVLLRRMLLLAWVKTHGEAPTAQEMGVAYTDGALDLAERFLSAAG